MGNSKIRIFWEIVPATSCNFCCLNCYAADNARPDKILLGWNTMKIALDKAISLNLNHIDILGGEPLTYPYLEKFIKYFKNQVKEGFCGVVSNGSLITQTRARSLLNSGINQLSISLDGTKAKVNDANRGKGSFKKILIGIKNASNAGIPLTIAYTITPFNLFDTKNLFPFVTSLGARAVSVQITENFGRAKRTLSGIDSFNRIEGLKAICKIFSRRPPFYIDISSRNLFKEFLNYFFNAGLTLPEIRCDGGLKTFLISSGGNIFPCSEYAYFPNGRQRNKGINLVHDNTNKVRRVVKHDYQRFNSKMRLLETKKYTTCQNCKYRSSCAPCPMVNPAGSVPECEWVKSQTVKLNNRILKSKLKLLIKPKPNNNSEIRFSVPTQKQPLFVPLSEKNFMELFIFNSVSEIIEKHQITTSKQKKNIKEYRTKFIEFLCKLRSHQVIEISGFNLS